MIVVLPQPRSLPRTSAKTSVKRLPENVTNPTQSTRRAFGSLESGDLGERDQDRDDPDRDVHEEDPPPTDGARDGAAEQGARPRRRPRRRRRRCRRRCRGPARERVRDQGERGGEHDGAADSLEGTPQIQHEWRGRQAAEQRRDREDGEAEGEDVAPPVDVAHDPGREEEGGERQGVGVDHPLQVREARVSERWMSGSATFTTVMSSRSMNTAVQTAISVHHLRSRAAIGGVYRGVVPARTM